MNYLQASDAERLVEALDEEIRSRGYGSIRAVERATEHSEGWWQHRAESGDINVHQLLAVLDHLGLDPVSFLRRALGAEGGLELDRPRGEAPEIVVKAWDRVRSGVEGSGLGSAFLDTLDKQRYQEPEEVVKLALWAVDNIELELLPRLLGVAGSALRLMILLDEAEHAIHAGIKIAQRQDDRSAVGDLLLRLSYVVVDRELHHGETALVTCELARILLAQGLPEEAFEAATSLHGLLEPLRGNKIISAAIGDLLRSGQRGLTLALVKRTMVRIEGERRKGQNWHSLLIKSAES